MQKHKLQANKRDGRKHAEPEQRTVSRVSGTGPGSRVSECLCTVTSSASVSPIPATSLSEPWAPQGSTARPEGAPGLLLWQAQRLVSPFPEERVRPGALLLGLGHAFIWGLVLRVCVRKCRNKLPLVVAGLCGTAAEVQACVSGVGHPEGVCVIARLHACHPPACPAVLLGGPSLPSQGLVYRGGALVAGPAAHLPVCPGIAPLSPRSLCDRSVPSAPGASGAAAFSGDSFR